MRVSVHHAFLTLTLVSLCRTGFASDVVWEAPVECPNRESLDHEIEHVVGHALSAGTQLYVTGHVAHQADRFTLSLRIASSRAEQPSVREFESTNCMELMQAAAMAVALAVTQQAPAQPVPQAALDSELPPVMAHASTDPQPVPSSRATLTKRRIAFGLNALADIGVLPSAGLGAELQLIWMPGFIGAGVSAGWIPARTLRLDSQNQTSFGLVFGDLLLCAHLPLSRSDAMACGVFEAGRLAGTLKANQLRTTHAAMWLATGVRLGWAYPLSPWLSMYAQVAVLSALSRPEFVVNSRDLVHKPSPVAGRLLVGLSFLF